jgi:hypothetical protein
MAQASRPMRRFRTQVKRYRAKAFLARANDKEIVVKTRLIMVVK